jgi:hypothetical protein
LEGWKEATQTTNLVVIVVLGVFEELFHLLEDFEFG